MGMKYYIDPITKEVYAYESDGSQDGCIKTNLVEIADDEADSIRSSQIPALIHSEMRAKAYREESDPLFFKEQRGEVPSGSWMAKCAEIQARWPQ